MTPLFRTLQYINQKFFDLQYTSVLLSFLFCLHTHTIHLLTALAGTVISLFTREEISTFWILARFVGFFARPFFSGASRLPLRSRGISRSLMAYAPYPKDGSPGSSLSLPEPLTYVG